MLLAKFNSKLFLQSEINKGSEFSFIIDLLPN